MVLKNFWVVRNFATFCCFDTIFKVIVHEKVAAARKNHITPSGCVLKTGGTSEMYLVCVLKEPVGIPAATKKKKHNMP